MKLQNDVLKQVEASLSFFVGTINFSDTMAAAAIHQSRLDLRGGPGVQTADILGSREGGDTLPHAEIEQFNFYNNAKVRDAVFHANEIMVTCMFCNVKKKKLRGQGQV